MCLNFILYTIWFAWANKDDCLKKRTNNLRRKEIKGEKNKTPLRQVDVIKNRVAPKFHASVNFNHSNKLLVTIHFHMRTKENKKKRANLKKVRNGKRQRMELVKKKSPEAKAMIYICKRHSQIHRKWLMNTYANTATECVHCVWVLFVCTMWLLLYIFLIMQYSFTTWHIKLLLFDSRMLAIKYWMAVHLAKNKRF